MVISFGLPGKGRIHPNEVPSPSNVFSMMMVSIPALYRMTALWVGIDGGLKCTDDTISPSEKAVPTEMATIDSDKAKTTIVRLMTFTCRNTGTLHTRRSNRPRDFHTKGNPRLAHKVPVLLPRTACICRHANHGSGKRRNIG